MQASAAGRSSCLRMMCRISVNSSARGVSVSPMSSSIPGTFLSRRVLFSPSPIRLLRRELSSLRPLHCAIASACLVSKLPLEASSSAEVMMFGWTRATPAMARVFFNIFHIVLGPQGEKLRVFPYGEREKLRAEMREFKSPLKEL